MKISSFGPAGLFRGSRPETPADWKMLTDLGVRTILNLEGGIIEALTRDSNRQQMAALYRGMQTVRIEMNALLPPAYEDVRWALDVLSTESLRPIFMHCEKGEDRTGNVAAAFRMYVEGWTYDRAVAEMRAEGFHAWYAYWLPALRRWE